MVAAGLSVVLLQMLTNFLSLFLSDTLDLDLDHDIVRRQIPMLVLSLTEKRGEHQGLFIYI